MGQTNMSARAVTQKRLRKKHYDKAYSPVPKDPINFAEWLDRVSKGLIQIDKD